jgi:hypothetical protein
LLQLAVDAVDAAAAAATSTAIAGALLRPQRLTRNSDKSPAATVGAPFPVPYSLCHIAQPCAIYSLSHSLPFLAIPCVIQLRSLLTQTNGQHFSVSVQYLSASTFRCQLTTVQKRSLVKFPRQFHSLNIKNCIYGGLHPLMFRMLFLSAGQPGASLAGRSQQSSGYRLLPIGYRSVSSLPIDICLRFLWQHGSFLT